MKKIVSSLILTHLFFIAIAQNFSPSNLIVFRGGDGTGSVSTNVAVPIFLDEFSVSGNLIQSVALPTTTNGLNRRILTSGSSTSEGQITRSTNGLYIFAVGYDAAVGTTGTGTTSLSGSPASTTNRIIARIDNAKNINTTTALADFASAANARSCASDNGNNIWCVGGASGVVFNTIGSTTASTVVANSVTNLRTINIFDNQLYIGTASGTTRLATVGSGLPSTNGQTLSLLPGITNTNLVSPYQFVMFDVNPTIPGLDVLYVTDDGTGTNPTPGIFKYSLVNGFWENNGVVDATAGYRGLTGVGSGSVVNLYAVKSGNTLVAITDSSGYNGSFTAQPNIIASAASGTVFRGVCFAPTATALPLNLISFNGSQNEFGTHFWWSTTNEVNTDKFEIEGSKDGINFKAFASVQSKNTTLLNSYQFTLVNIQTNYFRLKMIDKDGQFTYSNIIQIQKNTAIQSLVVAPNPVIDHIIVSHAIINKPATVQIRSLTSKIIHKQQVVQGATSTYVALNNLSKGVYIVELLVPNQPIQITKFIKQ